LVLESQLPHNIVNLFLNIANNLASSERQAPRGTESALHFKKLCTTVVPLVRGTIEKGGTVLKRRFLAVLASQVARDDYS
jgi:hypothetical protein